jgi:hypothetical protein
MYGGSVVSSLAATVTLPERIVYAFMTLMSVLVFMNDDARNGGGKHRGTCTAVLHKA